MSTCNCNKYLKFPGTGKDIAERVSQGSEIEPCLTKVETYFRTWKSLYKCNVCGQLWAQETPFPGRHFEGPPCYFHIKLEDVDPWSEEDGYKTGKIIGKENYESSLRDLEKEELGPQKCRKCDRLRIKFSVFCARHHMSNLVEGLIQGQKR